MPKIVINTQTGWFQLSEAAMAELGCEENSLAYETDHSLRKDPKLVAVVEKMGQHASGLISKLRVVEVPDDVDWGIYDHDGREFIYDKNKVWGLK